MADALELTYDVFSLPTAQHRAGLAGLYVVADTMRRRRMADVPDVALDGTSGLRLSLTGASLTALFNYLYEATTEEARSTAVRKKRDGSPVPPLREEREINTNPRTNQQSTRTVYFYPQVVPRAPFLESLGMPEPWLKLWRDVIWSTLRGIPRTRLPYEQRAGGGSVREAADTWDELTRWRAARDKGRPYISEVSSSLFVGAMARNAEDVPFVGSPDQNLLLHFWPAVMGVGEVWRAEREDEEYTEKPAGYVLAIPDVLDVGWFHDTFAARVDRLETRMYRYRPRGAVFALPEEGGLEYLRHLVALAAARARAGEVRYAVTGVEVYQLEKQGNSIRVLAAGRVPATEDLLNDYEAIHDRYRDLTFRGQLIRNLLGERPWYDGFDRLFDRCDRSLFVGPRGVSFGADAHRRFRTEFASVADDAAGKVDTEEGDGDERDRGDRGPVEAGPRHDPAVCL